MANMKRRTTSKTDTRARKTATAHSKLHKNNPMPAGSRARMKPYSKRPDASGSAETKQTTKGILLITRKEQMPVNTLTADRQPNLNTGKLTE